MFFEEGICIYESLLNVYKKRRSIGLLVLYKCILDLQPISRELLNNVARPLRLMPTIKLIKYSFVPHHQHGRRASQEYKQISIL